MDETDDQLIRVINLFNDVARDVKHPLAASRALADTAEHLANAIRARLKLPRLVPEKDDEGV